MSGFAQQAGYLLHYTPWRDTSFIVDLFTLEHGRLGLVARGARSAKPATRALYQPFRPLLVSWVGEGELLTLTGIEESGAALELGGAALASAYYLNELVLRLLGKEQPQPELFAHYALAIASLEAGASGGTVQGGLEGTLRTFELQLLEAVGLLPDLARCAAGREPIRPDRRYRFDPVTAIATPLGRSDGEGGREGGGQGSGLGGDGGDPEGVADAIAVYGIPKRGAGERRDRAPGGDAVHESAGGGEGAASAIEVGGRTLLDMARLDFADAGTREEAKRLMRALIANQLGGRPLRSRSMFEALVPPPPPLPTPSDTTPGATSGAASDPTLDEASGRTFDAAGGPNSASGSDSGSSSGSDPAS